MKRAKGHSAIRPRNGASFIDIARKQLGLATGKTRSGRNFVRGTPAQKRAARLMALKLEKEDTRQRMGQHKAELYRPRTQNTEGGYQKRFAQNVRARAPTQAEEISGRVSMNELANRIFVFRRGNPSMEYQTKLELTRLMDLMDRRTATSEDKIRAVEIMLRNGGKFS